MTSPDAEPGFRALNPLGFVWHNEVAARICTRLALYRPVKQAKRMPFPWLVCVADDDQVTPPGLALRAAGESLRAEVLRCPIGPFDVYVGESFERAVADQTAFLKRHLLGQAAPATAGNEAVETAVSPTF